MLLFSMLWRFAVTKKGQKTIKYIKKEKYSLNAQKKYRE